MKTLSMLALLVVVLFSACTSGSQKSTETEKETKAMFTGAKGEVKIMSLDPGHFHAGLILKNMYEQVSPVVHTYAPDGPDILDHLKTGTDYSLRFPGSPRTARSQSLSSSRSTPGFRAFIWHEQAPVRKAQISNRLSGVRPSPINGGSTRARP